MLRWKLHDPRDTNPATNTYVFEINPREMSSPFGPRALSTEGTVLPGGKTLAWEGNKSPVQWTFRGSIRSKAMYEALRSWVYGRGNRLLLTDHFGRELTVLLQNYQPVPKRSVGVYWRHDYEITALVLNVGAPTVDENGVPA